jgi:hypothetical protein
MGEAEVCGAGAAGIGWVRSRVPLEALMRGEDRRTLDVLKESVRLTALRARWRLARLGREASMPWDASNAAHVALFSSLKRDGQFREPVAFENAGSRRLSRLAYWLGTASPGMRRAHARTYISGMVLRLIYGHDLKPSAGGSADHWDAAYDAVEALMLDATRKKIVDVGELLSERYEGWDLP